jgi:hypothetical protein
MAAISDGLETAANRPGANVAARRSSGWGATKGLMIPSDRQSLIISSSESYFGANAVASRQTTYRV